MNSACTEGDAYIPKDTTFCRLVASLGVVRVMTRYSWEFHVQRVEEKGIGVSFDCGHGSDCRADVPSDSVSYTAMPRQRTARVQLKH